MNALRHLSILRYAFIGLLVIASNSCTEPNEEIIVDKPKTNPNLKLLSQEVESAIQSISKNYDTIKFNKLISEYKVGDILLSTKNEGILRKISSISNQNSTTTLITVNVGISEAFPNVEFNFSDQISEYEVVPVNNGRIKASSKTNGEISIEVKDIVLFDEDNDTSTKNDQVTGTGTLTLTLPYDLYFKTNDGTLSELKFNVHPTGQIKLSISAPLPIKSINPKPILAFKIKTNPKLVPIPGLPFPIVVTNVIPVYIGIEGSSEANVTLGISNSTTLTAGLLWNKGEITTSKNFENNFTYTTPTITAEADLQVFLAPELETLLYGIAGPTLKLKGYLEGTGSISLDATKIKLEAGLYGGIELSLGVAIHVFDLKVASVKSPLIIDHRIKLYEWSKELGVLSVTTATPLEPTNTSAKVGGEVISDNLFPVIERGIYWSTSINPETSGTKFQIGSGIGIFSSTLTGLNTNNTYYIKAYARNIYGISYGDELNFKTSQNLAKPTVITSAPGQSTISTGTVGGNVTADGGALVTERGVYWGTTANPESTGTRQQIGSGTGPFSIELTGLTSTKTYFYTAFAKNSQGEALGDQQSFTTNDNPNLSYGSLTDQEGNVYKTIAVGTQVWMAENLRASKYNDGISIPLVTDGVTWGSLTTPGYSWYNNDAITYKSTYGALYNWYTVNTGKLCPSGWHVPTDSEWTTLTTFLGGTTVAGGKLKETGTAHWASPNTGATNESGFIGLPGGHRNSTTGGFINLGTWGYWWSSTEDSSADWQGWARYLFYLDDNAGPSPFNKDVGFSVRCLKD